ncbi:leucine-rich repeat domain-containing protein, partial [Pontibacter qinzhouensis]
KTLQSLLLGHNQLKEVPESVTNLENLQLLDLSFNQLTTMPANIGKLKKLQTLLLTENNFSDAEKERIRQALPNTYIYF